MQPENNIAKNIVYSGSKEKYKNDHDQMGKSSTKNVSFFLPGRIQEDIYKKANKIIQRMS